MRLRNRAVLLLAIANAAVFGVLGAQVLEDAHRAAQRERETSLGVVKEFAPLLTALLDEKLQNGDPSQPRELLELVLSWPHWGLIGDAVFLDTKNVEVGEGGPRVATGLCVNPLGIARRRADFDLSKVVRSVDRAIRSKQILEELNGVAIPVISNNTAIGGAYFFLKEPLSGEWSPVGILITFLASTILLTTLVGYLVNQSVVKPVVDLASVSRRIARGDLAAVPKPVRSGDEMEELADSMAAMLRTLREHRQELERACEIAAARAKSAEHDLLNTRRLASMGELAAGIAHEINNPLGGLMNAVRMLRDAKIPDNRREEYYELVLDGLQRIQDIVGRVLTMAPRPTTLEPVDLAEPVADAIALMEHRARRDSIALEVSSAAGGGRVRGNRGELLQVFLNLIMNAIDAIAERAAADSAFAARGEGRVAIIIQNNARDGLVAIVRDNGAGVDPKNLDRVFDPFFTTKEPGKGSGLGLTVVFGILQNHRGGVSIGPAPGGGCDVTLRFPPFDDD
ncbi:MAG: HAMP domain-containing protein [Planctomycetes bacterium]|nr:HAMP domain-containing protein [Planctomycetota bacterium]